MNKREVTVTTTIRKEVNLAGWCLEKSENVVRTLARLHDIVTQKNVQRDEGDDSAFMNELRYAIHNAALLCTLFAGSEIDGDEAVELIAANGLEGFEEFAYIHGLIDETRKHATLRELEELSKIIQKEFSSGRPLANKWLAKTAVSGLSVPEGLEKLTDNVNLGEIDWERYCDHVRHVIAPIIAELRTSVAAIKRIYGASLTEPGRAPF